MTELSVARKTLVDIWDDEARRRISKVYSLLLELSEQDAVPTAQESDPADDGNTPQGELG